MFDLEKIVRENIKRLTPYSSARNEYSGATANVRLDANENSFGSPLRRNYNRYPDPLQTKLKEIIAARNNTATEEIFVGNGSDEAIDLLFRIFCEPRKDNVLICPPTYGMYEVSAEINDVKIKRARLTADFQLDFDAVEKAIDANTKLVFVCSPNNPTGNSFANTKILELAKSFDGIVAVDEAYIHFSREKSLVSKVGECPNLVVLQTLSKAWGLAGLRVGLTFAKAEIIRLFNRVKPPYNVSQIAQEAAIEALKNHSEFEAALAEIGAERAKLSEQLKEIPCVEKVYPSEANFILVRTADANAIYRHLLRERIVVRNRNNVELCAGCLRITIGTANENDKLLKALSKYSEGENLAFSAN